MDTQLYYCSRKKNKMTASKSQRILFVSTMKGDPWGGSEEFWLAIAIWMAKNGYSVDCAFYGWPTGKQEKIAMMQHEGINITQLTNPKTSNNIFDKLNRKRIVQKELKLLVQQPFDLICISQGGYEEVTHAPFRKLLPLLNKFVIINHNYNESNLLSLNRKQKLKDWTDAAALNMGDAAKIFSAIKTIAGFDVANQFVLKNPLTIPLQNVPSNWPVLNKNGNYNWVVMSQLDTNRKAQDILVKALSTKKWQQRNWELFLYGAGEDKNLLQQLINKSAVKNKIHLMGHTKQVEQVLQQSHLLLQITHIDAMPLSVTEAMNMAKPCVVSRTGDMPLWIEDNINGFIAEEVTEKGIDEAMERAWLQKENWQQMGQADFATFQQKYPNPYEAYYENIFAGLMNH